MIPELHTRAASWYEANGLPETAIGHAQRRRRRGSGGPARARGGQLGLVERPARHGVAVDGVVLGQPADRAAPAVAVHGALIHALVGTAG